MVVIYIIDSFVCFVFQHPLPADITHSAIHKPLTVHTFDGADIVLSQILSYLHTKDDEWLLLFVPIMLCNRTYIHSRSINQLSHLPPATTTSFLVYRNLDASGKC